MAVGQNLRCLFGPPKVVYFLGSSPGYRGFDPPFSLGLLLQKHKTLRMTHRAMLFIQLFEVRQIPKGAKCEGSLSKVHL